MDTQSTAKQLSLTALGADMGSQRGVQDHACLASWKKASLHCPVKLWALPKAGAMWAMLQLLYKAPIQELTSQQASQRGVNGPVARNTNLNCCE